MLASGWLLGSRPGGRAELDSFLAAHPFALLVLTLLLARRPGAIRLRVVGGAVVAAVLLEAALVLLLGGAPPPPRMMLGGLAAGLALALLLDVARRIGTAAAGRWAGALAAVAVLAVPGVLPAYRRLATTPEPRMSAERPRVALLTGLPLLWSEAGAAGTLRGQGSATIRALDRRFRIVPVTTAGDLRGHRLALIAQPRPLGPAGLVALDAWVRAGGRALLLVDPDLRWPSALPLGDPRRPPPDAGLAPLLAHWGVRLARGDGALRVIHRQGRRLAVPAGGVLTGCGGRGLVIRCTIGRGRAILVADADLLDNRAWIGIGRGAESRAARLADNPAWLAAILDALAGRAADATDRVRWAAAAR